jgi:hypothetical protein
MIKIEDNFLEQDKFERLQGILMAKWRPDSSEPPLRRIAWYYITPIVYGNGGTASGNGDFQFIHSFYGDLHPSSNAFPEVGCILEKLKVAALFRIKANLRTRTSEINESPFHVDIAFLPEEKLKQVLTSILYINSNNGYTRFEDGTKVESVANRLVTFPANMNHCGTSCTDENVRVVINFNYFK